MKTLQRSLFFLLLHYKKTFEKHSKIKIKWNICEVDVEWNAQMHLYWWYMQIALLLISDIIILIYNSSNQRSSVVYKCEVTAPDIPKKVYIGLTEKTFKTRYNSHKQSLNNMKYKNSTSLSSYVWNLKEKNNITPSLKWSIIKQVRSYTINSPYCPLCLQEKHEILFYPDKSELLNKRSELIAKCRHSNKFLLENYKPNDWQSSTIA
jgi:hypothetical protein